MAYQSQNTVLGEYMLCALFKSCLVLGTASKTGDLKQFTIAASINVADISIESADNAKGMQVDFSSSPINKSRSAMPYSTILLETNL